MRFLDRLRTLQRSLDDWAPLIEVRISREKILYNLHTYQKKYPALGIAPVVKSNAYGHGLIEIARILDGENIPFFMTDSWYEARRLRQAGIKNRILIMGYVRPELVARGLKDVDTAIVDLDQLRCVSERATRPMRLHLKVDTGMHRQGIAPEELPEAARVASDNPALRIVGLCSHFADADAPDSAHARAQFAAWKALLPEAKELFPALEYRHIAATAGMIFADDPAIGNVVRVGRGIYGYNLAPNAPLPLNPALELRSVIVSLRRVAKGESVGYNARFMAARDSLVATVPLGYFEGLDRHFSNKAAMLVRGVTAPIIGTVSMNMCSLDVTDVTGVARGDAVIAFSRNSDAPNALERVAAATGTHTGELLVRIPAHLRRVVE